MTDDQIEAQFLELGRRIAEFDSCKDGIKSLSERHEVLFQDLSQHKDHSKKAQQDFLVSDKKNLEKQQENSRSLDRLSEEIRNLSKAHSSLRCDVADSQSACSVLDSRISELKKSLCEIEEVKKQVQLQSNSLSSLKTSVEELKNWFREKMDLFSNLLPRLESKLCENVDRLLSTEKTIDHFNGTFCAFRSSQNAATNSLSDSLSVVKKSIEEKIEKRCSSIVIPTLDGLCKKEDLDKAVSQIESMALDAKNALLKSSNLEIQYQIQSKKLENLQLSLKNIELTR